MCRILTLALLVSLGGCHFYFGGDDDDPCEDGEGAPSPWPGLRNPENGQCEGGGGGGGGCDEGLPLAALYDPYYQDWAACYSGCEGLSEPGCLEADACRAIYVTVPGGVAFAACWGTAPSGPIQGGGCEGLDAYQCSRHNDCAAVHYPTVGGQPGLFAYCTPEAACAVDSDALIDQLRNPETGQCESVGNPCDPSTGRPIAWPDWAWCHSHCSGLDEESCRAADGCRAIYANGCPPDAGCYYLKFQECWATAPSGPIRGGGCGGLDAYQCSRHDDCTAEYGRDDAGALYGFLGCHDESEPPPPPPACDEYKTERACIESGYCAPIYEGSDCACDAMGCTCATWTFVACHET